MLFAKYRDWTPRFEHKGYELGFMEHDDGDVVKWDWTIYKFVEQKTYDDHDFVHDMFEEVCSLDVSPYERNEHVINRLFIQQVAKLIDNDDER
mgnify:FL=1|tara:strand:- start:1762 stop:2040 length:279 start_codon:yes stop_codon:yes gene_type:complete